MTMLTAAGVYATNEGYGDVKEPMLKTKDDQVFRDCLYEPRGLYYKRKYYHVCSDQLHEPIAKLK